ncbi:hypothetical protein BCR36DRAFT_371485 [Piromyces finnis]|uniref:UBX domain-containing protein 2 n=1 Tax=Piromyces finnis TaxID=1754191 RepID=A0A1Y1V5L8_9FUNG|nr:hypothetical protein BCR36DRAFT_371485 [Piromyces finnis]|eukprot:ORX47846.1 hypothetical protein BCR36DRAFT_371485 [Piromyces finnis]
MDNQSPWFEGSVAEAVSKTQEEKKLFLALVYDDDENSTKIRELLTDSEISALIKNKSIAIEIKKGSETFNLFSQVYPTFFCPCLIFIQNGRLVFFLNAEASKEKIIESINKYSDIEQATTTNQTTENNSNSNTNPTTSSQQVASSMAQNAQKEKELNDEKKKERIEELKKRKQDNDARRKQILEQINNDRKERESRNSSRANSTESLQNIMNEKPKSTSNSNEVLISVRYLNGTLFRQEFKKTQKLSDVRKWIDDTTKAKDIFKPYNLETKYPEHQFTFGEETKTLIELNLDDTDLLICKPVAKVFSSNPRQSLDVGKYFTANFFKDFMLFIYAFILSLNVFRDPAAANDKEGSNEGQGSSNQTISYRKGKIRIHGGNNRKIGTLNDIRNNDNKPKETYNGNSTNQQ